MSISSVAARVARVNPLIVLPGVGVAAWFAAGLLIPGTGATPAEARPAPGAASSPVAHTAPGGGLPDRLPDSLPLIAPALMAAATPAPAPLGGGVSGANGGAVGGEGGSNSASGAGQPRHRGQTGQAGATQPDHARRYAQGLAGLHRVNPHAGQPAPTAGPHPRMAYVAPVAAPPPRVMAPAPSLFPFFGGGRFIPRANPGGGHFGGGGGRHR